MEQVETINQKEYLKKYLGIGKAPGHKKKKKKPKGVTDRVKIIDDDADSTISNIIIEDDLQNEDAPQIVAIIDERPPSLRVDEKTQNPLWQPIGTVTDSANTEHKQMITSFKITAKSSDTQFAYPADRAPPKKKSAISKNKQTRNEDHSPPRKTIVIDDNDSPPRKYDSDDDASPPRKRRNDSSPPRKSRREDYSPPRKSRSEDNSPPRKSRSEDNSPPRKPRRRGDDDYSSPRKSRSEGNSPPRKPRSEDNSPPRRRQDDDISPPRKFKREDISPLRRKPTVSPPRKPRRDDISPPRKIKRDAISPSRGRRTVSPPRKSKNGDVSPPRRRRSPDTSPPRRRDKEDRRKRETSSEKRTRKMDKTLDGKTAGLQNAKELVEESQQLRHREDQLFKNLSKDQTGENAETVFRDRKSGKVRNLEEEEERQRKKREEEEKNKEKYSRWGRGLAQVESRDQKIQEELHEMSKPLARYADDEDLERYLKEQEREGDPMLQYIRSKKRKKLADAGVVTKPEFEGNFMPNRFGIKPGHRWDGVDRSNGYEKKWFEVQNAKTAQQEDVYKWSTEDM